MKVFVASVDERTGAYSSAMIDESVAESFEIQNALGHLGVSYGTITWEIKTDKYGFGRVDNTTKVVTYIV